MLSSKVLYLDFDGVLHPASPGIDGLFSKAHLLEPLLEAHPIPIIVASSWRFTHSLKTLQSKLPKAIAQHVAGTTGTAVIGKHARFQEITKHLQANSDIHDWRALDDSYWEFPSLCKELIRCNPNTGISPKEVTLLADWLAN